MDLLLAFLVGLVTGGLLRGLRWSGGLTPTQTPPPPVVGAPPSPARAHLCVLVDTAGRVVSYRQVDTVPSEFPKYHGRGVHSRFVRDGADAEGHPLFRLVG